MNDNKRSLFHTALDWLLDHSKVGVLGDVADHLGIDQAQMSRIRKTTMPRANRQEQIAEYFGLRISEMMRLGEQLRDGENPILSLPQIQNHPEASPERAAAIFDVIGSFEFNLHRFRLFTAPSLDGFGIPEIQAYLDGEIGDEELADVARTFIDELRRSIRART